MTPTIFSPDDVRTLGLRAETMVNSLGTVSAAPDHLVRLFLTPEHRRAADRVSNWMREAGLAGERGRARHRARAARTGGPKRLLIGSHIDTVINAGMYDGPFGVIARHSCGRAFRKHKAQPAVRHRRAAPSATRRVRAFRRRSRRPRPAPGSSVRENRSNSPIATGVTLEEAIRAYGKSPGRYSGRGLRAR